MPLQRKTIILAFFFLFALTSIRAQKEGSVWYFGHNAGLDFNFTPPKVLTNGAINTYEGCATVCNKFGQLLFYTDGIKVYDKTHAQMPNGDSLTGDLSSTQSGIIVQNPDTPHVFYVFTTGAGKKFAYSVVDTSLNGGKGDVRLKNVQLLTLSGEKLTAIKHKNGRDTWVLTHQTSNNSFFAYLVTKTGVNSTAVVSSTGLSQSALAIGYLKASPDGKKLAAAEFFGRFIELFDFNNATGVVSNAETLTLPSLPFYGVEFSASGRYLYVTAITTNPSQLFQFDLKAGSLSDIVASKYSVNFSSPSGALQLATDGKIYMANFGKDSLGVINYPEKPGATCDFIPHYLSVAPRVSAWGLPSFNQSFFFEPEIDIAVSAPECNRLEFDFEVIGDTKDILSYQWDFGDGTQDTGKNITKVYHKHGIYNIKVIVETGGNTLFTDTLYREIKTMADPAPGFAIVSREACVKNNKLVLADTTRYFNNSKKTTLSWIFSDSLNTVYTDSIVTKHFKHYGKYTVKIISVSDEGCADSTEETIVINPSAQAVFFHYPKLCFNDNLFTPGQLSSVDTPGKITGYWWDFGDGTYSTASHPVKKYTDTGTFPMRMAALDTNGCNDTVSLNYTIFPSPSVSFTVADVCYPDTVKFINTTTFANGGTVTGHNWDFDDGETFTGLQKNKLYSDTGMRTVSLITKLSNGCSDTFSKTVYVKPRPKAAFHHTVPCTHKNILFSDKTKPALTGVNTWHAGDGRKYTSTGDTTFSYSTPGNYRVKLLVTSNNGCADSASKTICVNPKPTVDFGIDNPEQCFKGNNFKLNSVATTTEGRISHYEWMLDSALISNQPFTSVAVGTTGTHSVSLKVATDSSCSDSVTKPILVHPRADMQIGINDTSQCEKDNYFVFNNSSSISSGSVSYRWIFSTRDTFNLDIAPPVKFNVNGRYQMQVIATSDKGCRDTSIHFLSVNFNPEVDFTTESVCVNDSAFFENTSLYSG
ncbi:MAG TPA: PKD domain-containing protein, partial [Bacteroidia bacterium]|nr:PKD domain-containing protein [Bacteroidia bacterium]